MEINEICFLKFGTNYIKKRIEKSKDLYIRLAKAICGYKVVKVDNQFLNFLNNLINKVEFYEMILPPNMQEFYYHQKEEINGKGN
ncbi:MAG: hypothetical protein ACI4F1_09960 [Bariatricus sp.]